MRFFISGGVPCPLPLYEGYWGRGLEFKQGYGLTEAGPNTFALHGEDIRHKPGGVGRPLLYVETCPVGDDGRDVPAGEVGEPWVRGPHVFAGYWRRPEATAEVLVADGWLKTGDLSRRDEDSCYYIVDRKKQIVITGGENAYPLEVETVLHSHAAVAPAAVFGVPDPRWGEAVTAAVVLRAKGDGTGGAGSDAVAVGDGVAVAATAAGEEALRRYCPEQLASYNVPRGIHFLHAMPLTPAGKVDKKALRKMLAAGQEGEKVS